MQATVTLYNLTGVPVFVCGSWIPASGSGSVPASASDGDLVKHYVAKGILSLSAPKKEAPEPTRVETPPEPPEEVSVTVEEVSVTVEEVVVSSDNVEVVAEKVAPTKPAAKRKTRTRSKPNAKQ